MHRSKRDAQRRLIEILADGDKGGIVPTPTGITVGDFLRQWLEDSARLRVRTRTAEGYAEKIEGHLIPGLGRVLLRRLQPDQVQEFYRKCLDNGRVDGHGGLSPRSVLHLHRILHAALRDAIKQNLIVLNAAAAATPPRPAHREMNTFSGIEMSRFLESAKTSPYYPVFYLALYTGLRRGELLGLRVRDIDVTLGMLSVTRAMHQLRNGEIVFTEPKSKSGRRTVALPPSAALVLKEHLSKLESDRYLLGVPLTHDDLVFSWPDGRPMLPGGVSHAWINLARSLGYDGVRFHDGRHTHASIMLSQNVHPKVVQERLGHSNIGITLDTYSHVLPGLQEAAALRFDEGIQQRIPQHSLADNS